MQREDLLDADAVGDLAHGEAGVDARATLAQHGALEDLHALLLTLGDAGVNAHGLPRTDRGDVVAKLIVLHVFEKCHVCPR